MEGGTMRTDRLCLWMELLTGLELCPVREWRFEEWWSVLRKIDAIDARVVVMRIVHGLEWPDIAERLEVSRMRCDQRFKRALMVLGKGRLGERLRTSA